ncbi:MAG: hypothetical protein JF585_00595, partial [Burkholderiales bacterium]|nr:hypothetical protein [Burkholderiales bacterium]
MIRPNTPGGGAGLRAAAYAIALILPPLLAYNRTPSATQLNELLCIFGWGLCLLAANRIPNGAVRRGATTSLGLALGILCVAVIASWTLGSLPTSLALPPL